MGVVSATPDAVVVDGELTDEVGEELDRGLDVLRKSEVETPIVDLTGVTYISSKSIGLLVSLWVDLIGMGRWFDLQASDCVWDVLRKAGVAGVFFKRPG